MLVHLKKLAAREVQLLKEPKRLARVAILLLALAALSMPLLQSGIDHPSSVEEYARTSVKVLSNKGGGGSGVILKSTPSYSIILTNNHVCEGVVNGGIIEREGYQYKVSAYKKSKEHDLCEVKVNADLGVNTEVADEAPRQYSSAIISGHPALLPHVLTKGSFSGRMNVNVMVGVRPCSNEEIQKYGFQCLFGMPILVSYDAQLVSATILPGSSGSAVFNDDGEIAGLVFASNSRELSYAIIVPQEYVQEFVSSEADKLPWILPQSPEAQPDAK